MSSYSSKPSSVAVFVSSINFFLLPLLVLFVLLEEKSEQRIHEMLKFLIEKHLRTTLFKRFRMYLHCESHCSVGIPKLTQHPYFQKHYPTFLRWLP